MRDLMKPETLKRALPAGLGTFLMCVPFVVVMTPPGQLRTLRVAFLAPVMILLFQVGMAWTPLAGGKDMLRLDLDRIACRRLAILSLVLACVTGICVDPTTARFFEGHFPASLYELLLGLPWVVVFQPLVLVVGAYAFAARLTRRPVVALVAVVVAHQGMLMLKAGEQVPVSTRALLVMAVGVYALIAACAYRAYGFVGPVVIELVGQLRHVLRLL